MEIAENITWTEELERLDVLLSQGQMKLSVELDDEAKAYIVDKGYDAKYGARPLRRTIQNEIEDELAERILEGKIKAGNKVLVTVKDKKLDFVLKRGHNR